MRKYYLMGLLLLPLLSIAQSNYKSAYVVTLKGDTLHGLIDYKEWGRNPKTINFKSTQNDKTRQLGLSDINHFELEGYVSYHQYRVGISLNPVDISSPLSSVDTSSVIDNVFLKTLSKGKNLTLYSYKDGLKERFYLKDNNVVAPIELLYGIYQDPNGTNGIINKKTFQAQLNEMAVRYNMGNDNLIRQIQRSNYKEYDLIPIVAQINGNTKDQASVKSQKNSPIFRLFVGGAFSSSTLKTSVSNGSDYLYGAPPSNSGSLKIAAGIDAVTNPDVGHLIFRLELAYSANNFTITGTPNPIYNIAEPEVGSLKLKQNLITVTPQVIYNVYNAAALKVFLDLGYSFNVASYPTKDFSVLRDGEPIGPVQKYSGNFKSLYSVLQFKAGVTVAKRFEIYGAYFPSGEITQSNDVTMNVTSYQVGLSYILGKVAR